MSNSPVVGRTFVLLLLLVGCARPAPTVEVRPFIESDGGGTEFDFFGETVRLGSPYTFAIADVVATEDVLGGRALRIDLQRSEFAAMESLAKSLGERPVGVLLEGKLYSIQRLRASAPVALQVSPGYYGVSPPHGRDHLGFTEAEASGLVKRLSP